MGIIYYQEPKLENPQLLACWPGLGNISSIAADQLKKQPGTEELGEIEPWDLFYPRKAVIRSGVLSQLEFPASKFYFRKLFRNDLIVFNGEKQPTGDRSTYAGGEKALKMANLVLDAAEHSGCRRIFTSCAAISQPHHTSKSRVWVAGSREDLNKEILSQENTILMTESEGQHRYASLPGLNGLLLGLARKRGLDTICLMGEIPDYLAQVELPYPRASRAILEVISGLLGMEIDYSHLDEIIGQVDIHIDEICKQLPLDIKEKIEQRKSISRGDTETITEQDEKWFKEHIDEIFKKGNGSDK